MPNPTSLAVNGQTTSMSYDIRGNLSQITKNGISNSFTYTLKNDVASHTDGRGNTTNYQYDASGNLINLTRPTGGGTLQLSINAYGQPTQVTNPSGIATSFGYDTYGNLNSTTMPLGITTTSTYDDASRVIHQRDANNRDTYFAYDNNDNDTMVTDAYGNTTRFRYDANDNLTNIRNAKGENTVLNYSSNEDYLTTETFGPHTNNYTYKLDGSLNTATKPTGTFTYIYDSQGRLTSDGQSSYTYWAVTSNLKTITNANGTLTLYYDVNDRLDHYTDYFGNTITYTYDNNSNVTSIAYPGSNHIVTYHYDANNRMDWVQDWNGQRTTYSYLTDDRVNRSTYPNGTYCQYTYDAAGRLTGIDNKRTNGSVISQYTVTLDAAGNHLSENFTDPATSSSLSAIANGTTNYPPMPYNRIQQAGATNFTHDGSGNITQQGADSYTFDLNDNLLSASGSTPATYTYDGAQNRRTRTAGGSQVRYVLNILGMTNVLAETNSSNTVTGYYIYGAMGLVSRILPNNTTHYYHYDYRGSTAAMTNSAAVITHSYAYSSFGAILTANEPDYNPFRYNGQYGVQYDAPNRIFMRARYMDPTTGRFIAEDPIWATNLYPFTGNNPINYIDPTGLQTTGDYYADLIHRLDDYKGAYDLSLTTKNRAYRIASTVFTAIKFGSNFGRSKDQADRLLGDVFATLVVVLASRPLTPVGGYLLGLAADWLWTETTFFRVQTAYAPDLPR